MFRRWRFFKPLPPKKQVNAHLDFLDSVAKPDNPIKQCDTCIHAKTWTGDNWCDFHRLAPTGVCMERNKTF